MSAEIDLEARARAFMLSVIFLSAFLKRLCSIEKPSDKPVRLRNRVDCKVPEHDCWSILVMFRNAAVEPFINRVARRSQNEAIGSLTLRRDLSTSSQASA